MKNTELARAINSLSDYADDLDYTERPAPGEYDVAADIRLVCQALVGAVEPHPRCPCKPAPCIYPQCTCAIPSGDGTSGV